MLGFRFNWVFHDTFRASSPTVKIGGMRKGFRQGLVLILLVAVTSIYLNGTRIFTPSDENASYLGNLRYEGTRNDWNQSLFGEQARWASMENYIRLTNEYDSRRAYGLLNDVDEARYHQEFRQLARSALSDLQHYQEGTARGKVLRQLDNVPSWYAIRTSKSPPLVIAGLLAAAYSGQMLRYRLGNSSAMEARTLMQSTRFESQYFGWSNTLLGVSLGSTYDGATRGLAMSARKDLIGGVSVSYDRQTDNSDAIGMSYSTGF